MIVQKIVSKARGIGVVAAAVLACSAVSFAQGSGP
ncbi:MAG: hypothetical protein AVDCRST_MAG90-884, partial [uncultured Microvirga sp.]